MMLIDPISVQLPCIKPCRVDPLLLFDCRGFHPYFKSEWKGPGRSSHFRSLQAEHGPKRTRGEGDVMNKEN